VNERKEWNGMQCDGDGDDRALELVMKVCDDGKQGEGKRHHHCQSWYPINATSTLLRYEDYYAKYVQ
jgi:hypothetical protein